MKKSILLLALSLISLTTLSFAQQKRGNVSGTLHGEGEYITTNGAIVSLISGKDTLNYITTSGYFGFKNIPAGKAKIKISHVSFEPQEKEIVVLANDLIYVSLELKLKSLKIDDIKIKGSIPLVVMRGDTMQFNAAAVKLMEGDETLKILENIPGVIISDDGIKILGKDITRTYVDGALLFGSNAMSALKNLPASDVISIDTYDEKFQRNPKRKIKDGEERVLNIKTRSKLISALNGHFLASGGRDMKGDKRNRYGIGATANFFSEKFLLSFNSFSNNLNRNSNLMNEILSFNKPVAAYTKKNYIGVETTKKWGDPNDRFNYQSLDIAYNYDYNSTETENITERLFFPTDNYNYRKYSSENLGKNIAGQHNSFVNFTYNKPKLGNFYIKHNLVFSDNKINNKSSSINEVDDTREVVISENGIKNHDYSLKENINYHYFAKKSTYVFSANYIRSRGSGDENMIDSVYSTSTNRVIDYNLGSSGDYFDINGSISYHFSEKKNHYLSINVKYSYDKSESKRVYSRIEDIDSPSNIYDYKTNYNTIDGGLKCFIEGKYSFSPEIGFKSSGVNKDEYLPTNSHFNKRYNSFLPALKISRKIGLGSLDFTYKTSHHLPSIDQWQKSINDKSPLFIIVGNPDLKPSYVNSVNITWNSIGTNGDATMIFFDIDHTSNSIVNKSNYYTENTPLDGYENYIVPANSTVSTFVNAQNFIRSRIAVNYSKPLKGIKCMLTMIPILSYEHEPTYTQNELIYNNNYGGSLALNLSSNFSRKLRLKLGESSHYIHSIQGEIQTNNIFRQTVNASFELLNIYKTLYLKSTYLYSYNYSLSKTFSSVSEHILNAMVGVKFFKNTLDITVSAFDILNKNSNFSSRLENDYIQNNWKSSFGQYFTINIGYKFFKSKSSSPGTLPAGEMKKM